jgi:hypothetical protein
MSENDNPEMRGAPHTGPAKGIPADITQNLIGNPKLWHEASNLYFFIRSRQLFDNMNSPHGDVRWVIFFVLLARYFDARPDLGRLVSSDDDIPF